MSFDRLRRFDVQANYASLFSLASVVPMVGGLLLTFRNYQHDLGQIIYGQNGTFVPVFAACVLASMVSAAIGTALGWSSAGQRRNEHQARSWVGFFVGGVVVSVDLVLLAAFVMLRFEQPA